MIRNVKLEDAKALCDIYNHYIENSVITFEEEVLNPQEMEKRIKKIVATYPWIVYEDNGQVVGYAYASKWKERSAYRYCVESSIYLRHDFTGNGVGRKLYKELIDRLDNYGIENIIACIALPNPTSVGLHEKLGFKKVGEFNRIGYKQQQWLDAGYWQYNKNLL